MKDRTEYLTPEEIKELEKAITFIDGLSMRLSTIMGDVQEGYIDIPWGSLPELAQNYLKNAKYNLNSAIEFYDNAIYNLKTWIGISKKHNTCPQNKPLKPDTCAEESGTPFFNPALSPATERWLKLTANAKEPTHER